MADNKIKDKVLKTEGRLFKKRVETLGFKQTEVAILLKKPVRVVNFYIHSRRHIPPEVWVRLAIVEEMEREQLWRLIVKGREKSKKKT